MKVYTSISLVREITFGLLFPPSILRKVDGWNKGGSWNKANNE
jgi:hypothetical protein